MAKSQGILTLINTFIGVALSILLYTLNLHVGRAIDVALKSYTTKEEFVKHEDRETLKWAELRAALEKLQSSMDQRVEIRDSKYEAIEARLYKLEAQSEANGVRLQAIQEIIKVAHHANTNYYNGR